MTSDAFKALEYAENELGVHSVYEGALISSEELSNVHAELIGTRSAKRDLEANLVDRELELASEQWGKHPELSATRMDQIMRRVKNEDQSCREIRERILGMTRRIESGEYRKSLIEADIRIAASRLQELGGYLQYLAAIKQAHETNRTQENTK